ncbi:MAG: hypothetical protein ACOCSF_07655 [Halanaeroarchaeum sp.]
MERRTLASVLWGLVGALAYLVLAFGLRLLGRLSVDLLVVVAVAVPVFVGATVLSHLVGRRLDRKRSI